MAKKCIKELENKKQCNAWALKSGQLCFRHDPNTIHPKRNKPFGQKYNVKGSDRQEKLAKLLIQNKTTPIPRSKSELVKEAGYGHSVQLSPAKAINTTGVISALAKHGLTIDLAVDRHKKILAKGSDQTALNAVKLVYEVEGIIGEKNSTNATFIQILNTINKKEEIPNISAGNLDQLQSV